MEARIITLRQQQQQVQTRNFTPLTVTRGLEIGRRELVKGQQLLEVTREGVGILQADGEQCAGFEGCSGESQ